MTDAGRFHLADAELERLWAARIQRAIFGSVEAVLRPVALFVGAQPGAGKTAATIAIRKNVYPDMPMVTLDSDALRTRHPAFDTIMASDRLRMPVLTNQAAAAWFQMGLVEARRRRCSVVVENIFHDPTMVIAEAGRFRDMGYRVHVAALAVPACVSRLGILQRYLAAPAGHARWTTEAAHQAGVVGVPRTLTAVIDHRAADRMTVARRDGNTLFDGQPSREGITALDRGRRPPVGAAAKEWLEQYSVALGSARAVGLSANTYAAGILNRLAIDAVTMARCAGGWGGFGPIPSVDIPSPGLGR